MGRRGPKPQPTAILKMRGSRWAESRMGEPELVVEEVPCPAWVGDEAREYWPQVCDVMRGIGCLSKVFAFSMGTLCNSVARYVRLFNKCKDLDDRDELHKRLESAEDRMNKQFVQHGMTPSSLSAVKSLKAEEKPQGIGRFKLKRG